MYVDTREMLETFSKDMIYMRLPPPYTQTLFIELIRFVPGVPENVGPRKLSPSSTPRAPEHAVRPHSSHTNVPHPHSSHRPAPPVVIENGRGPSSTGASNPPPPPWTNQLWSNAGATAPPPLARPPDHLRSPHPSSHITPQATPQPSRKRKYPDEMPPPDERVPPVPYSPAPRSPKRRQASHTPQPAPRTSQGLSPSLAMMLSPNPVDVRTPPRPHPGYSGRPMAPTMSSGSSGRISDESPLPSGSSRKLVYTEVHADRNGWGQEPSPMYDPHRSPSNHSNHSRR